MSNIDNKTELIKEMINNMEKLFYSPYIYKICTLKPEDIYYLFYKEPHLTCKDDFFIDININQKSISSNQKKDYLFNVILNFIYVNVYYFDIIINPEKYFTNTTEISQQKNLYIGHYGDILNKINDTMNIDSNKYLEIYRNTEQQKKTNTNEYDKHPKRIFIKTFIKLMKELISKYIELPNNDFILKVIYNVLSDIKSDKILYIHKNGFLNSNLIDKKVSEYSKDTILTYLKVRNTNTPIENYNRSRFNIIGYGVPEENYSDTLFLKYKNDTEKYSDYEVTQEYTENHYTNEYLFGPFNRIFFYNETNKDVANNITDVKESLINGKNIFIIGYGASGSGKTSTLVYLKTPDGKITEDGIIVHICKNMKGIYDTFKVKCIELASPADEMNKLDERIIPSNSDNIEQYLVFKNNENNDLVLENAYEHKPVWIDKGNTKIFNTGTKMGDIILYMIDDDRYIRPTTNNPKSSRSHYIIFIEMSKSETNKKATLIVGDFAGVENTFNCNEKNIVEKYFNIGNINNEQNFENYYTKNFENYDKQLDRQEFNGFNVSDEKYNLIKVDESSDMKLDDNFINNILDNFEKKSSYSSGSNIKIITESSIDKNNDVIDNKKINKTIDFIKKNFFNYNDYLNSVRTIFFQIYKTIFSDIYKNKNKDIKNTDDIMNKVIDKINKFFEILNNLKDKANRNIISAKSFLYNYHKNNLFSSFETLEINGINILNLINFSKKIPIEQYLSISKGGFYEQENSFIFYLVNFNRENKNKLYNLWGRIFNEIIEKKKEQDEEEFNKKNKELTEQKIEENKLNYIKAECGKRVVEGQFINRTLAELRELITNILKEKNKNKISISPQFLNECFDFYCTKNNCFEISKEPGNINGNVFKILKRENIDLNQLIMCVFCVLNISPNANNPPPVQYIDINRIKKDFFNEMNSYKNDNFKKFVQTMRTHLTSNGNISNFNNESIDFLEKGIINYSEPDYNRYKNNTRDYINYIDNYNAITSIGTLDFVDKIAKFNLTDVICNHESGIGSV